MELKHEGAGQNVHDAVAQYVPRDHSDRIFQLHFLHIAANTTDVQVATAPRTEKNFRWFNFRLTNHALTEGKYPVEFLYREVLSKDTLPEAVSFYLVNAPAHDAAEDREAPPTYTLFPLYHQRRCVEKEAAEISFYFLIAASPVSSVSDGSFGGQFRGNSTARSRPQPTPNRGVENE